MPQKLILKKLPFSVRVSNTFAVIYCPVRFFSCALHPLWLSSYVRGGGLEGLGRALLTPGPFQCSQLKGTRATNDPAGSKSSASEEDKHCALLCGLL